MKKFFFVLVLIILAPTIRAQFDAQFSQYWSCKNYYNPASVGLEKLANVSLINKTQWAGIKNAPQSLYLGIDMPITFSGKAQGVGLNFFSDKLGLFSNSSVMLNYAYKLQRWGGTLSLGGQIGFVIEGFDGTKVVLSGLSPAHDKDDPAIPTTNVQAKAFDAGLGAYYSNESLYIGISGTHLMEPTLDFDDKSSVYVGRIFYVIGGYSIPLNESDIVLLPSTLIKSNLTSSQIDLTLRAQIKNKIWGGMTYRWNNSVVVMVGAKIDNISIGYAYDISTSKLFSVTSGSHEIFASYSFQFALQTKNKSKINKSVRYL
ncbi:MAG: type IX secretion system membrane protein PorP/SprF [Bacteroidales bacterium]|nr:type IX secretion system membrane protein PorP/SprF [Bacteroidales bacterium]